MHEACVPDQGLNQLMRRRTSEGPSRLAHVGSTLPTLLGGVCEALCKGCGPNQKIGGWSRLVLSVMGGASFWNAPL